MSEEESKLVFENWFDELVNDNIHNSIACENLFLDRTYFITGWEGAWAHLQAKLDAKDKELAALRACILELNKYDPAWLSRDFKPVLFERGLLDADGKPTPLLTGQSEI